MTRSPTHVTHRIQTDRARQVGLSILGSLQRELGNLDRIARWVRGRHARSAIGVAALPFNIAVEIQGEVLLRT